MRVIKKNNIERKHKCELCKSIFAYKNRDIDLNLYPTVRCPVCGKLNKPSIFDRKVKKVMRNPERIKPFLKRLEECWKEVPDWRFGQLLSNVLETMDRDIFFLEDDEMIEFFEEYFERRRRKDD